MFKNSEFDCRQGGDEHTELRLGEVVSSSVAKRGADIMSFKEK